VDILLAGDVIVDEPDLTIPHPRMYGRRFVMQPLADLAPDLVPEDWERRVEGSARPAGNL
jgi:2-amino-4-hydroxy-6-hydroxymethyldihydropteridine diphosphokinase